MIGENDAMSLNILVAVIMCYMVIDCDVICFMALCSIGGVYVVRFMALCSIRGVYVVRSMALCSNGGVYMVRSMALCLIGGVYVVRFMALCSIGGVLSYAFSDSLLLTPLCCDDIHDVTPHVSALAGCDRLVSEPLVIENSLISLNRGSFDVIVGMDWLSKRKFVIVCHEKVVRIPLEGDEILRVHGERTQGVVKTLVNTKHVVHSKLVLELLRKEKLYAKVTYLRFIANFSKIVKLLTSLTERNQKYEWGAKREKAF
ncbi:hypothetical protein Tco_0686916 [Tanacetum coccineum]